MKITQDVVEKYIKHYPQRILILLAFIMFHVGAMIEWIDTLGEGLIFSSVWLFLIMSVLFTGTRYNSQDICWIWDSDKWKKGAHEDNPGR